MRSTSRLLATVKSATKFLEPNTPTGLTGLPTHPAPRPALIWTYRETLKKLGQIPKSSVYRQSTEALTKQRLEIVEAQKPEGYEQWLARVRKQIEANPAAYNRFMNEDGSLGSEKAHVEPVDVWDGMITRDDKIQEGTNSPAEAERKARYIAAEVQTVDREAAEGKLPTVEDLEVEPPLTREQYGMPDSNVVYIANGRGRIETIETKIGAGLIEEVVQVAEGELHLVDEMLRDRPWEELEEKAPAGQWSYFERGDTV
ncbi:hypothetical protein LTR20_008049 [Exophiala xenobiotica]|nr:hypothetical protein LTR92_003248 [Exophiala xenobiotica]KAK5213680.1 hypothetical protein LTR41_001260 [Exophiala xenobiotica]KAK5258957.1 hypothetical protein LTR40_006872 [Exophiala xenobiotica]KAK5384121.1 hypothetical protein LTS13_002314 [Exophiala xenobiotica]KAK5399558.1 hypothetical protein LTR79_003195 [Exophiala xenobiotica]